MDVRTHGWLRPWSFLFRQDSHCPATFVTGVSQPPDETRRAQDESVLGTYRLLNALTTPSRLPWGLQIELEWVERHGSSGAQAGGCRDPCAEALPTHPSLPKCPRPGGRPMALACLLSTRTWSLLGSQGYPSMLCPWRPPGQGTEPDTALAWVLLPTRVWGGRHQLPSWSCHISICPFVLLSLS